MLYVRVPRLFEDLALARLDGRFPRLIDKLTRAQLLILDDFGTHSLTDQQRFHRIHTPWTAEFPGARERLLT